MQNQETNFKLKKTGGGVKKTINLPKWFTDFANQIFEFIKRQEQFNARQEQFNQETNKKFELIFDILKRNNLK